MHLRLKDVFQVEWPDSYCLIQGRQIRVEPIDDHRSKVTWIGGVVERRIIFPEAMAIAHHIREVEDRGGTPFIEVAP